MNGTTNPADRTPSDRDIACAEGALARCAAHDSNADVTTARMAAVYFRMVTVSMLRVMCRNELIIWLTWNDPNGCFADAEATAEGFEPLTREEALELALDCFA